MCCIGAKSSSVMCVPSGIFQGSVISPLLFLLFINDLADIVRSVYILLYADDLKLLRTISCLNDRFVLLSVINEVMLWSKTWMLPLSLEKLAYLHIGSRFDDHTYNCDSCIIKQAYCVKNLDVIFSDTLVFRERINNICKKSNALFAMIFRSFDSRNAYFLISLFNIYVRPQLEYASSVWSPHLKMGIAKLERVQRMYTKRIPALRHLCYVEHMAYVGTRSLEHRRLYFDLLDLYKIVHGLLDVKLDNISITPSVCMQASAA